MPRSCETRVRRAITVRCRFSLTRPGARCRETLCSSSPHVTRATRNTTRPRMAVFCVTSRLFIYPRNTSEHPVPRFLCYVVVPLYAHVTRIVGRDGNCIVGCSVGRLEGGSLDDVELPPPYVSKHRARLRVREKHRGAVARTVTTPTGPPTTRGRLGARVCDKVFIPRRRRHRTRTTNRPLFADRSFAAAVAP